MIGYVDQLSELDTDGVEPMSHAFPVVNRIPRGRSEAQHGA